MDTNTAIILAAIILAVGAVVAALLMRKRQSHHLKAHFGPEYERALDETGDRRKAEHELHQREKRVKQFDIRPLEPADRSRFVATWTAVQSSFVDDPKSAVLNADDLLAEIMAMRGYPVSDFDQRAADLSVEYPTVVQNYRAAHDIALKHQRGDAGTEDLRQAMIHYRALFEELTAQPNGAVNPPPATPPADSASRYH